MAIIFDGPSLQIRLDDSALSYPAAQIYSAWKDWVLDESEGVGDHAKWPPAFRVIGGDALGSGSKAPAFFFLRNDLGWHILKPAANIDVIIDGNLVRENPSDLLFDPGPAGFSPTVSINLTSVGGINVADFWSALLTDFPDPDMAGSILKRVLDVSELTRDHARAANMQTKPS